MKKIIAFIPVLLLFLLPAALRAETADVAGDWDITVTTQRGEMTWEAHFVQEGESLTVTMKGRRGNEVTGEGTIKENAIEWTITSSSPRGEMTITWSGEVSGETMSGEVQFGSFRTAHWEGTKRTS
jgi:hypothetical protein